MDTVLLTQIMISFISMDVVFVIQIMISFVNDR